VAITGNLIWLERRDARRSHAGNRLMERATVGVALGCVVASAAYFAANRVLPAGLPARSSLEFRLFLLVWALCSSFAFVPRVRPRSSAALLSAISAALFLGVSATDLIHPGVPVFNSSAPAHV